MSQKFLVSLLLLTGLFGCFEPPVDFPEGEIEGYKAIYASEVDESVIDTLFTSLWTEEEHPLAQLGK